MNTPCGLAASMAAGNSPNPTKTGVATFLSGVTSALSSENWLTGHKESINHVLTENDGSN
mgnify:FL=1